jgi:uncharacterized protein (TIGR02284 family)
MAVESKRDVSSVLNDLIETNKDGYEGFKKAATDAKTPALKTLFAQYASEREANSRELQNIVNGLGENAETSGSIAGGLHRGWISLKEAVSQRTDKAIIDECEAGEDAAMKNYREALTKGLPSDIQAIVEKQFAKVQAAHNRVRDLKHQTN